MAHQSLANMIEQVRDAVVYGLEGGSPSELVRSGVFIVGGSESATDLERAQACLTYIEGVLHGFAKTVTIKDQTRREIHLARS